MSEAKRKQLIESGQLNPDGSRKERCPACGSELTAEEYAARFSATEDRQDAVAIPAAVAVDATAPTAG